jgi:hypothetical protein
VLQITVFQVRQAAIILKVLVLLTVLLWPDNIQEAEAVEQELQEDIQLKLVQEIHQPLRQQEDLEATV